MGTTNLTINDTLTVTWKITQSVNRAMPLFPPIPLWLSKLSIIAIAFIFTTLIIESLHRHDRKYITKELA